MKLLTSISLVVFLTGASAIGQSSEAKIKQYVVAPSENVLLVVASQPDCPLVIEQPTLLIGIGRGTQPIFQYRLRNTGKKAIRNYSIAAWSSDGTGGTLGDGAPKTKLLLPSDTSESRKSGYEIVPLTDDLRDNLGLRGDMQSVTVLIIESVKFDDGSSYNGEVTSKSLIQFFEKRVN